MAQSLPANMAVLKALADVNRLRIVGMLSHGEQCACRILERFNITQPTLSHHMKILCGCGLVAGRKAGRWTYYSLDTAKAREFQRFICAVTANQKTNTRRNGMSDRNEEVRNFIRQRYAGVARGAQAGCCGASCGCGAPGDPKEASAALGYSERDLTGAPPASNMGLGCGNPIAIAALQEGETVLDLGSGGGFDCFLARRQVGETGHVIGVDMTPDMISLARENVKAAGYTNVEFRLGEIEHLPVEDNSVDAIISNCVINLSPDKEQVFREAFRVLKPGGRLSASDVVATAEIPRDMMDDLTLVAGCIGGAEYVGAVGAMLRGAGFCDIRMAPKENSGEIVNSWVPEGNLDRYIASYIIGAVKG